MNNNLIIYIAGYGRSGSTVLDYKLSKYISALSLGEISMLNRDFYLDKKQKCSCGKKYNFCKLAKKLVYKNKKKNLLIWYKKILPQTSKLIRYFLYFYLKKIKKIKNIKINSLDLIEDEFKVIKKLYPNSIYLDSSKSTTLTSNRPFVLQKLGYEVIIIHLRRPFFQTFKSVLKGSNAFLSGKIKKERPFRLLRFFIGYFLANYKAKNLEKHFPYITVYNKDSSFPQKELKIIKKLINKILLKQKIKFKKTKDDHLIGGNRLKNKINLDN